jgi:hypothetical protein
VNPYPLAIQPGNAKTNLQKYGLNIAQDPSKDSLFHQKNGQPLVDTQFFKSQADWLVIAYAIAQMWGIDF